LQEAKTRSVPPTLNLDDLIGTHKANIFL